ncbi:hypothetical protein, partial [Methanosarcina spelaei]|uniref:hypothetical protein n=1 Tax=Methanosarcina spelaei TaxID=1036679 RepID=UPI001BAEA92F
ARTYPVACSGVRQRNFDLKIKYLHLDFIEGQIFSFGFGIYKELHWSSVKEKSLSIALIFIKFVKLFIKCKTGI